MAITQLAQAMIMVCLCVHGITDSYM